MQKMERLEGLEQRFQIVYDETGDEQRNDEGEVGRPSD